MNNITLNTTDPINSDKANQSHRPVSSITPKGIKKIKKKRYSLLRQQGSRK